MKKGCGYKPRRLEILEKISIVDTPGTNAIVREHEALTAEFIPRSDLVLFITSADRPFTESERNFLTQIRDWGKKIVLVVNKVDILPTDDDVKKVVDFVTSSAHNLVGEISAVFPVSAKLAQEAKSGKPQSWEASGFDPLESFIHDTLDDTAVSVSNCSTPLVSVSSWYKNSSVSSKMTWHHWLKIANCSATSNPKPPFTTKTCSATLKHG